MLNVRLYLILAGLTGLYSVYSKWKNYEIMYHVATLLPFSEKEKQQLERKRHIGNDIVIIVFQDSDTPFDISTITSQQIQVVFVVKNADNCYHLTVFRNNGVPPFEPSIPDPPLITKDAAGRDFFILKRIFILT